MHEDIEAKGYVLTQKNLWFRNLKGRSHVIQKGGCYSAHKKKNNQKAYGSLSCTFVIKINHVDWYC
jgi:hypothetical protein